MEFILETISLFILNVIDFLGYGGVFVLMLFESANVPMPSEVIMVYAGFLAASGRFDFWLVVFLGAFGNLVGSLISYWLGFFYKEKAVVFLNRWLWMSPDDFSRSERWIEKYGLGVAFFSRMTPIVRTFISVPAGIFNLPVFKFSVYTFSGSFVWSWFLTYIGFVLGENWASVERYFRQFDIIIALLAAGLAVWWVRRHLSRRRTNKA